MPALVACGVVFRGQRGRCGQRGRRKNKTEKGAARLPFCVPPSEEGGRETRPYRIQSCPCQSTLSVFLQIRLRHRLHFGGGEDRAFLADVH
jgi:hypothetical protein